ncbi:uncharacterized protein LOC143346142 [Colletes latitarsis]|uniref:uncharacterized protein LOC143346142 n=1 Tax=Colletes latitarsis TaxID=2605962 RepID=UPI004036F68B
MQNDRDLRANVKVLIRIKRWNFQFKALEGSLKSNAKYAQVSNMFVRVILITTIFSFVSVRSIESQKVQLISLLCKLHPDMDMNAASTTTVEQKLPQDNSNVERPLTSNSTNSSSPQSTESISTTNHGSMHPGMKHPKKRATNYKEDRPVDLQPSCCG